MRQFLLLAGPVVLVLGRMVPQDRPKLRMAALVLGGSATVWGAWRTYQKKGATWAS